jgi:ABC-type phosphate/phosphonate transport system substrate-binding protein
MLSYTSPASAEVTAVSGVMTPSPAVPDLGDLMTTLETKEVTVASGEHLSVVSVAQGNHTCAILDENFQAVDQDTSPSHICYLRYMAPQDGRLHHMVIVLYNPSAHNVSYVLTTHTN